MADHAVTTETTAQESPPRVGWLLWLARVAAAPLYGLFQFHCYALRAHPNVGAAKIRSPCRPRAAEKEIKAAPEAISPAPLPPDVERDQGDAGGIADIVGIE